MESKFGSQMSWCNIELMMAKAIFNCHITNPTEINQKPYTKSYPCLGEFVLINLSLRN